MRRSTLLFFAPLLLVPGCQEEDDFRDDYSSMVGTGSFSVFRPGPVLMAIDDSAGCNLFEFQIATPGPCTGGLCLLSLTLPGPFYPGRTYGPGTYLEYAGGWGYISDGGLTIEDVAWTMGEEGPLRVHFLVQANFSAMGGESGFSWNGLVPTANQMVGMAAFSVMFDDYYPCTRPEIVSGPPLDVGMGATGPGYDRTALEAAPVLNWGTADNEIAGEILAMRSGEHSMTRSLTIRLTPAPEENANYFCWVIPFSGNSDDAQACSSYQGPREDTFDWDDLSMAEDSLEGPAFSAVFQAGDYWGLGPTFEVASTLEDPPAILSPLNGVFQDYDEPITVSWEPLESNGAGTVRLTVTSDINGVLFSDTITDTGSHTIDAAILEGTTGPVWIALEWTGPPVTATFEAPVRETSQFSHRLLTEVSVNLTEPPPDDGIPDPEDHTEGWSTPVPINDLPAEGYRFFGPRTAMDADGVLYVAWTREDSNGKHIVVEARTLDTRTGTWSEVVGTDDGAFLDGFRPQLQGISGSGGQALTWFWRRGHEIDPIYTAVGLLLEPDQSGLEWIEPSGLPAEDHTFDFGGLFIRDAGPLLLLPGADGVLYQSLDGQTFEPVATAGGVLQGFAELYPLPDGRVAGKYYGTGSIPMLTAYDPALPAGGSAVDISATYAAMFDAHGTPDRNGLVHARTGCSGTGQAAICYGRYAIATGEIEVQGEIITTDSNLCTRQTSVALVAGADDSIWALVMLTCDDLLSCPVLFQQTAPQTWSDPLFPGWASGEVSVAVDADGGIHVIYVPYAGDTGRTQLLYTSRN